MKHSRVRLEGHRQQRPDVVLEVAHTGDDPVRGADVVDESQIPECPDVAHDFKYASRPLCRRVAVDVNVVAAVDAHAEPVIGAREAEYRHLAL